MEFFFLPILFCEDHQLYNQKTTEQRKKPPPNEGLASKPSKLKVKAAGIAMANFVEVALQRLLLLFCYPPSKAWPSVRKILWWLKLQQLYVLLGNVRHTKIWLLKFFSTKTYCVIKIENRAISTFCSSEQQLFLCRPSASNKYC